MPWSGALQGFKIAEGGEFGTPPPHEPPEMVLTGG